MRAESDDVVADRVALGLTSDRNRELLESLLASVETVTFDERVPPDADLCIVDEGGFGQFEEPLTDWKAAEQPTYAPVLLLAAADNDPWQRYADALDERLDAIQPVPAPSAEIRSRVDGLLTSREHSLTARQRRERLELYERALDGATVGVTISEATDELPLVYVNEAFCDLTGYDAEACLGRNARFLQGEKTEAGTVAEIRAALHAERPVSVEIRNYRKDGSMFWNDLELMPVTDDEGTVTHYVGFQRDITPRKTREALLERYERIVQSVGDPILVLDEGEQIIYANEALSSTLGYDTEEVVGASLRTLFDEDGTEACRQAIAAIETPDDRETIEATARTADGEARLLQLQFQRSQSIERGTDRIVVVSRDITTLREQRQRLSVLDRVLRHNLRNKMQVILSNLAAIERQMDADLTSMTSSIRTAGTELLELSDEARQFQESIDPDAERVATLDVTEIVRDVADETETRYPEATVETDLPPEATAQCPEPMRLCLQELLESTLERSDSDDPTVRAALRRGTDHVELDIIDGGESLSESERKALERGHETQLEHTKGLGLWLVKWAVTSVGGEFTLGTTDSEQNVVSVRLPPA